MKDTNKRKLAFTPNDFPYWLNGVEHNVIWALEPLTIDMIRTEINKHYRPMHKASNTHNGGIIVAVNPPEV